MTENEHLTLVLSEVGPAWDPIEHVEVLGENSWIVGFNEGTAVEVHLDSVGHCIHFVMPLGPIAHEDRAKTYEVLLSYNFLKQETGGFHMALDGDAGNVYLMLDVHHPEINVDAMTAILATIFELGHHWREVLSGNRTAESMHAPMNDQTSGAIRV